MKNLEFKTRWGDTYSTKVEYDPQYRSIYLVDADTGESFMDVTKIPPAGISSILEGYVCVKDYSENEGILQTLIEAGIVSRPMSRIPSGFVYLDLVEVLPGIKEYIS